MSGTIDLTDVSEANQPAIAAYCAEFVMGRRCERREDGYFRWWHADGSGHCMPWYPEDKGTIWALGWRPFTSWDDDGAVLVHVRENWDIPKLFAWEEELALVAFRQVNGREWGSEESDASSIFNACDQYHFWWYITGNYCLAACRVVQETDDAE